MNLEMDDEKTQNDDSLERSIIRVMGQKMRSQKRGNRTLREIVVANEQTIKELKSTLMALEDGSAKRNLIAEKLTSEERWMMKDELIDKELKRLVKKYRAEIKHLDDTIARLSIKIESITLKLQEKNIQ